MASDLPSLDSEDVDSADPNGAAINKYGVPWIPTKTPSINMDPINISNIYIYNMDIDGIHIYDNCTPVILAYIPAAWILWDSYWMLLETHQWSRLKPVNPRTLRVDADR